ncbi:MAG: hypothetical protein Q6368_003090 [Candidatus Baldrarchaeota archaeon]
MDWKYDRICEIFSSLVKETTERYVKKEIVSNVLAVKIDLIKDWFIMTVEKLRELEG